MTGHKKHEPKTRTTRFLRDLMVEAARQPRTSGGHGFDESDIDWDWIDQQLSGRSAGESAGDESGSNIGEVWAYRDITYKCNDCGRLWISKTEEHSPAVPIESCPFCDQARYSRESTRLQIKLANDVLKQAIPSQLPYGERFVRAEEINGISYITFFSNIQGRAFTKVEIPLSLMIAEGQRSGWSNMYHWLRKVFTRMTEGGQVILLNK